MPHSFRIPSSTSFVDSLESVFTRLLSPLAKASPRDALRRRDKPLVVRAKLWHRDERGSVTYVSFVVSLLMVLMAAYLLNLSWAFKQKRRLQAAADAGADAVGAVQARHMNALTGMNHLIGELLGMVIVHHAIGGDNLDKDRVESTRSEDTALDAAHAFYNSGCQAASLPLLDTAYDTTREKRGVRASKESMEYKSKVALKELLTTVYNVKGAARWMQATKIPYVVAAGEAMHTAAHLFEQPILWEYKMLDALHQQARATSAQKVWLRDVVLPEARRYAKQLVDTYPENAAAALRQAAQLHDVELAAVTADGGPRLPVEIDHHAKEQTLVERPKDTVELERERPCDCPTDKVDITRNQLVKITQLCRATFPWVNYHRQPVLEPLERLFLLSQAGKHYKDFTDGGSKTVVSQLQLDTDHDLGLHVLRRSPAPDKAKAIWIKTPDVADELFATVVVASDERPQAVGTPVVFPVVHPEGTTAIAQVLLYNANPCVEPEQSIDLRCKRIIPNRQADFGFDTLNWKPGSRPYELVAVTNEGGAPKPEYPEVLLNWQSKLVPVSATAIGYLKKPAAPVKGPAAVEAVKKLPERTPDSLLSH
jgi:hypothetical protein